MYRVARNEDYDFINESYRKGNYYPNLHKYPATMIPQVGIKILRELGVRDGAMLDPYCGSGSSFACGIEAGINDFTGFDLNPLAVLISRARFTWIEPEKLRKLCELLRENIHELAKHDSPVRRFKLEKYSNFSYWFKPEVAEKLQLIKEKIAELGDVAVERFLLVGLSLATRDCSYVRNNEFKLYRMKREEIPRFSPNVLETFFGYVEKLLSIYQAHYCDKLKNISLKVFNSSFTASEKKYDVVLTSPPYGDSRTTVAYGQFSLFTNEWLLGDERARKLDKRLMGGSANGGSANGGSTVDSEVVTGVIREIAQMDAKRALEVATFYSDLKSSINEVSKAVAEGGKVVYIAGNRTVKGKTLPTDQFIAECFASRGFRHILTYERLISNKRMPRLNSPSNKAGAKVATMNNEFIVVCEKL